MSSSLEGVRVIDLSRLAAGNMISHMLADHGADVIKVERPEKGDDLRTWKVNNISHWWHVYSCLLYTSPSPRDMRRSRMPSSA